MLYKLLKIIVILFVCCACKKSGNILKKDEPVKRDYSKLDLIFKEEEKKYLKQEELNNILDSFKVYRYASNKIDKFKFLSGRRNTRIRVLTNKLPNWQKGDLPIYEELLKEEHLKLKTLSKDSISTWIEYADLIEKRDFLLSEVLPGNRYLSVKDIQQFIRDSFAPPNMAYYKNIISEGIKRDSIAEQTKIDSLKKVIHPVSGKIPYGSKLLLDLYKNKIDSFGYKAPLDTTKLTVGIKNKRRAFFNTIIFYLELHPYVEDDAYSYMPKSKTHKVLHYKDTNKTLLFNNADKYYTFHSMFYQRLPSLGKYETYFDITGTTTGGCDSYGKKEENCCFYNDDYDHCESLGKLILYDRASKSVVTIPAFGINKDNTFRFFILPNTNTIVIYEGKYIHSVTIWDEEENYEEGYIIYLKKVEEINVNNITISGE